MTFKTFIGFWILLLLIGGISLSKSKPMSQAERDGIETGRQIRQILHQPPNALVPAIEKLQTGRWAAIDQINEGIAQRAKERRLHCWQTGQRYC